MSSGTTGASRPTVYTQWDRDVGALLTARALYMQGIRPGDVVMNSWLYGTHNGAWIFDEALYRWLNCVVVTASAGSVTSSERQVQLAIDYGVKDLEWGVMGCARYDPRTGKIDIFLSPDTYRQLARGKCWSDGCLRPVRPGHRHRPEHAQHALHWDRDPVC